MLNERAVIAQTTIARKQNLHIAVTALTAVSCPDSNIIQKCLQFTWTLQINNLI